MTGQHPSVASFSMTSQLEATVQVKDKMGQVLGWLDLFLKINQLGPMSTMC